MHRVERRSTELRALAVPASTHASLPPQTAPPSPLRRAEFHAPGNPDEPIGSVVMLQSTEVESKASNQACFAEPNSIRQTTGGTGVFQDSRFVLRRERVRSGGDRGSGQARATGARPLLLARGHGGEARRAAAPRCRPPAPALLCPAGARPKVWQRSLQTPARARRPERR